MTSATPGWLYVGRITAPFGVAGEVRAIIDTEFPDRLTERPLFVGPEHRPLAVEGARPHGREVLVKFAGVDSVAAADALRGQELFIATADATPLPAGRYYIHQVVGLEVWTVGGERYGEVAEVLSRPANDVYVVHHAGKEVLVPAIADVVKEIDIAARRMVIEVIPGLE
jgi:16S rRNA processing protein RimM